MASTLRWLDAARFVRLYPRTLSGSAKRDRFDPCGRLSLFRGRPAMVRGAGKRMAQATFHGPSAVGRDKELVPASKTAATPEGRSCLPVRILPKSALDVQIDAKNTDDIVTFAWGVAIYSRRRLRILPAISRSSCSIWFHSSTRSTSS
jgi:hypothetical protein